MADGGLLARDFRAGQLPRGPAGPQGAAGATGATGATGPAGPRLFVDALQAGSYTWQCFTAGAWHECATVNVVVPANRTYRVMIDSAGTFFAYLHTTYVRICTSVRPASATFQTTALATSQPESCANVPTGVDIDGDIEGLAANGVRTLTGGASGTIYVVGTAVHTTTELNWCNGCDNTVLHTLVTVADVT